MKSLLTRLTETIGEEIATNINNNLFEKLVINKSVDAPLISDFSVKELIDALAKEDPDLLEKLGDYVANSKQLGEIAKKRKPKQQKKPQRGSSSSSTRSRSRSNSSSGGCGSSRSSSSCGSGSYGGWGSSCGRSSYSRSGC